MNKDKLEYLRSVVNSMLELEDYNSEDLLEKSRELDDLILKEMREKFQIEDEFKKNFDIDDSLVSNIYNMFHKMYDSMRLINPKTKEVIDFKQGNYKVMDFPCYRFWEKNLSCDNCISERACMENETVYKLENSNANVPVRQVGEADYSKPEDKRFEWSLDYTFLDKNGVMYSGQSTRRGRDTFVNSENRVYYFPFAPNISSLESEAEPKLYQPVFLVVGIFLLYVVNIGRPKALAE